MKIQNFFSQASFWIPECLAESTWSEHAPFAFWLIDVHRPRVLVELGTHNGFSYFAFSQAVKRLNVGTACFAVDTWEGDAQAGFYGSEVFERVHEYHDRHYKDFSRLIKSTFDDALSRFADNTIDLLHIDGRHSYENVKHDFEKWRPKVSGRGVVLFHDTRVLDEGFGVHRLWAELQSIYPHFEFEHGCGLGVLGLGKELQGPISELFSAVQDAALTSEIGAFYQRLGYGIGVHNTITSLRNTVNDKETHIQNLERLLTEREREVNSERLENRRIAGRLALSERELTRKRDELRRIQNSASWRMVQRYWSWNVRHFPFGSPRRAAFERVVGSASRLLGVRSGIPQQHIPSLPVATSVGAQDDNRDIVLTCDDPVPGQACAGVFFVRGWAVATSGISRVEISIDGKRIADASYGLARTDVVADFPNYRQSDHSGFFLELDTTTVADGSHTLTITAVSQTQQRRSLSVPITVDQSVSQREYDYWIATHEPSAEQLREMASKAASLPYRPLISIAVPIYRTDPKLVRAAIHSVRAQIYDNWELCLANDGSHDPELSRVLAECAKKDSRIKYVDLAQNGGIATATNEAVALASGEFVAFLDSDDELTPDALYEVARAIRDSRDVDVIYSDEDKLDDYDRRYEPFFKPDWSPDLLLSCNYICHFLVVRRQLLMQVGGLRSDFDGSQDYDLLLRLMEKHPRVIHISKILYHWRACATSTASSSAIRPKAHLAAERAISDYLQRNDIQATVSQGCDPGRWVVRYAILENPKVSIVIPTGGRLELLQPCIESIHRETDYSNYEILLVDNSRGSAVQEYAMSLSNSVSIRYVDYRGKPFNYSTLNNFAVKQTEAPLLLFLNDDTTATKRDWLTAMVEHGQRSSVGAVGAKLVYPGGSIQHAGVVLGLFDNAGHAFKHIPSDSHHYFCFPQLIRNCSAVTAACMMTRRAVFQEIGGFDEKNLAVAFQDVDYCLRLRKAGYFIVYTPAALLVHHESVTKHETVPNPREVRYMQTKWADVIAHDPFYSPHLTRTAEDYSLRLDY